MLTKHMQAAMGRARYEILSDDNSFYGEIPGLDGLYANAITLERCRNEFEEVLDEWLLARIANHMSIPSVDGVEITIKAVV